MKASRRNCHASKPYGCRSCCLSCSRGISGCILSAAAFDRRAADEELADAPPPDEWMAEGASAGAVARRLARDILRCAARRARRRSDLNTTAISRAAARVEQAAAFVRAAGGALWPAVTALGRGGGEMSGDNSGLEGWLVSASWEIDLWGRVRYSKRSAEEQYASTEADFSVRPPVAGGARGKVLVPRDRGRLQHGAAHGRWSMPRHKLLELAEQRLRVGIGNELDVASARVTLQTYRDNLRQVQLACEQSLRALELLIGRYPGAEIGVPTAIRGNLASEVPAGLPSELLERRPDVIAAEKRVAAAFSRVKEAQAARLPRVSPSRVACPIITSELFVLQDRDNPVWSVGGTGGGAVVQRAERSRPRSRSARPNRSRRSRNTSRPRSRRSATSKMRCRASSPCRQREAILAAAVADAERALFAFRNALSCRVRRPALGPSSSSSPTSVPRMNLLRVQTEQRVQRVNLHLALGGDFAADA